MADNPGKASGATKIGESIEDTGIGNIILGKDNEGNAVPVGIVGIGNDELKVSETFSHLLKEILVELKINNEYLAEILGDRITEIDIKKNK